MLLPGQRMSFDLQLRRAPLAETIALNPHPPIMESARTHASAFVAETEIEELPIAGRRYLRLAELTPAVTQDAATGGVSVMDLPSAQNRILIDGFDHTSSITGDPIGREGPSRVPYQVSQWSVQAFRIHTNGAPAENGRAGASVIDVVTKSGANEWHASGYEFFGDRALNGKTTLDERAELHKPPYRSHQFGGVVGGPILRDHNFFLVSYDGLRRIDSTSAAPDLTPFFGAGPVAVGRLGAALARTARDQDQDLVFARTDHEYFRQHLTLRYIDQQFAGQAVDATALPAGHFERWPRVPANAIRHGLAGERDRIEDRQRGAVAVRRQPRRRKSGNDACRRRLAGRELRRANWFQSLRASHLRNKAAADGGFGLVGCRRSFVEGGR